jgi:predicted transcriptional regulator
MGLNVFSRAPLCSARVTPVRLTGETLESINFLVGATNRSKSCLLQEAVEQYVQREKAVVGEIRQGLDAMNEGRTVSHKVVKERLKAKGFNV